MFTLEIAGYPKTVNVTDVPGPVQSFERLEPYEDGKAEGMMFFGGGEFILFFWVSFGKLM